MKPNRPAGALAVLIRIAQLLTVLGLVLFASAPFWNTASMSVNTNLILALTIFVSAEVFQQGVALWEEQRTTV